MDDFATLLQTVYTRVNVPAADQKAIEENLKINWFDSPAIIGSSKISDLAKIDIPENLATQLIEEAKIITENNSKPTYSSKKSYSSRWGNPTPRINYGIKDDLSFSKPKNDYTVHTNIETSESKEDLYKKYFEYFIRNETDLAQVDRSLKKMKFILGRINTAPDVKEFRQIDPDNPEIHKLILSYESLTNVMRSLGFETVKSGKMELKSSKLNIQLIQECLAYIRMLRKNEKEVEFGPEFIPEPKSTTEDVINKWNEQLQSGHELVKTTYGDVFLPKVMVISSASDYAKVLENQKKMLDQMETTRSQININSSQDLEHLNNLQFGAATEFPTQSDIKISDEKIKLERKQARINSELEKIQSASDEIKLLMEKFEKDKNDFQPFNFQAKNMTQKSNSYCRSELKTMLGTDMFDESPVINSERIKDMFEMEKEFEKVREQINLEIQDTESLGNVYKELNAFASDQRTGFLVYCEEKPILYIMLYQGEIFTTLFDIIGFKVGLESDDFYLHKKDNMMEVGKNKLLPVGDEFQSYFAEIVLVPREKPDPYGKKFDAGFDSKWKYQDPEEFL